jgi:hypothetical protein
LFNLFFCLRCHIEAESDFFFFQLCEGKLIALGSARRPLQRSRKLMEGRLTMLALQVRPIEAGG